MNEEYSEVLSKSLSQIKDLIDVNIVVGKPIYLEESLIIPISKVKCAFISGGMNNKDKLTGSSALASNINVIPIGFLVKEKDSVKVLHLEEESHVLEYILDTGFDAVKTIIDLLKKKKKEE